MLNIKAQYHNLKNKLEDKLLKRIVKNSGVILFGNSTAAGLGIISFTILAGQVGPESLAILVLAQTYALIINDIFNIQTWESMVKFGASELKSERIKNVIKTNLILDFASAIIAFGFALMLVKTVGRLLGWQSSFFPFLSLYSASILFNITTLTIGIPRLFNKFASIAKIQVVMAVIKLCAVLYAMASSSTFTVYIYIYLVVDILTNLSLNIYSIRLLTQKYGRTWIREKIAFDKNQLKFIWWTNLRTIIRIPVRHLDMIVISSVLSVKMVGIYKVYKEIAGLINRVGEPINQSMFPEFTKLIGSNNLGDAAGITKKTMLILLGVGSAVTLGLLLTSRFLVGTFFGEEYLQEIYALYLMLFFFSMSFITVPINSLFIAAGFAKYSFMVLLFTNTIYLMTLFSLGKLIGIYGIIAAFALQLVLNKGLKVFLLKRYYHEWGTVIR
ncbi:MAG: oligosaccharide flippase family protein [Deltaproteobacteria bacterium]|nr:oligosaccharide flippase family protein [Deltaproteobacteria bacterium]